MTLTEMERTLVQSKALGSRFRPHHSIPGVHLLDWNGEDQEVTFNPELFDDHPNTLTLLSIRLRTPGRDLGNRGATDRGGIRRVPGTMSMWRCPSRSLDITDQGTTVSPSQSSPSPR